MNRNRNMKKYSYVKYQGIRYYNIGQERFAADVEGYRRLWGEMRSAPFGPLTAYRDPNPQRRFRERSEASSPYRPQEVALLISLVFGVLNLTHNTHHSDSRVPIAGSASSNLCCLRLS
jgi:hypothetical protein